MSTIYINCYYLYINIYINCSNFPIMYQKHAMWYRICGLALASLMCTTAASRLAITGGGYLATIILSFIAIHGWRLLTVSYDVSSKYIIQKFEIFSSLICQISLSIKKSQDYLFL